MVGLEGNRLYRHRDMGLHDGLAKHLEWIYPVHIELSLSRLLPHGTEKGNPGTVGSAEQEF
jgi:hypothetical protein